MAKTDDTTKSRARRTGIKRATPAKPGNSIPTNTPNPSDLSSCDSLKQAIEAERTQLMQAHAVVKTLSAALMNAEDDHAMLYVDTANVAADLIDEAVGRLDKIGVGKGVREPFVEYGCFERWPEDAPSLSLPRGAGEGTVELAAEPKLKH